MNEHIVTGCRDCPMCNSESDGWDNVFTCNYNLSVEGEERFEIKDKEITPEWCPLNQSPITIIKKE